MTPFVPNRDLAPADQVRALLAHFRANGADDREIVRLASETISCDVDWIGVVLSGFLETWLSDLLRTMTAVQVRTQQAPVARQTVQPSALRRERVERWGDAVAQGLMHNFTLPNGRLLAHCTRNDLTTAAAGFDAQIADMGIKARWFRLIASSLREGQTVEAVFTNERLERLRTQARQV